MTSSARDVRYGRRGGGWAAGPARALPAGWTPPDPQDHAARFHPDAIAQQRAHDRRRKGTCNADSKGSSTCSCVPDPADLADVWAGRARMARARQAAGRPLDPTDHEALERSTP